MKQLPPVSKDPTLPHRLSDQQAVTLACEMLGHQAVHATTDGRFQCRCGFKIVTKQP